MSEQPLALDRHGDIAWLILNRPAKRNAMSQAMWLAVPGLVGQIAEDRAVKLAVVRGAGSRVFCAGADIGELAALRDNPAAVGDHLDAVRAALDSLARLEKPTIAMIHGPCMGGGAALALACDFRLADEAATFAIPPAKLGLAYGVRETKRLADTIGLSRAKDMLLTARSVGAAEALDIGLVNGVYPAAALASQTAALAGSLCDMSQSSLRAIKRFAQMIEDGAADDTAESLEMVAQAYDSDDHREGVDAFLQKRRPRFTFR